MGWYHHYPMSLRGGQVWWGGGGEDEINFDLWSLRRHGTSGCPVGSWSMSLELRRKVWIEEIDEEPSV